MRAQDIPQLDWWLKKSGYIWLHHDSTNEMLELMANEVSIANLEEIKAAKYFAVIMDETSDISRAEQVSISFRVTLPNFEVKEIFMGFHKTSDTKSETLSKIIHDVLLRFNLNVNDLRGQCFDGAANMSGEIFGVQTRIREIDPIALRTHSIWWFKME